MERSGGGSPASEKSIKQGPSNHFGKEEGGRIHNCNNIVQGEVLL